jgi:type VI secretion system secreted protein Hcp
VVTAGSSDGDVEQTVGMEFGSVRFEYRRQHADGSFGSPTTFDWDIRRGTVSTTP